MSAKFRDRNNFFAVTPNSYELFKDRHKKIISIFSKYKLNRILDIGCGNGGFSIFLKETSGAEEVYGIEISEIGVKMARKKGVKAIQLDIDEKSFPFKDKYFDAIFAGEIIEHLYYTDKFLEECWRCLDSKGIFVLTTRNLSSLFNRITLLLGYQPFSTSVSLKYNVGRPFKISNEILGDHIRIFTLRAIKELLFLHKFKIIKLFGTTSVLPNKKSFILSIIKLGDIIFSKFPSLSQGIIILCRKNFEHFSDLV